VLTARPLISDLKRRYPNLRMFLSTTTMAGQQLARRNVPDVDAVFYFPFDFAFVVRRTLDLVRPKLFVMMETEIWPNLLRECRARGVKTAIVNGRLSPRSFPRYRMIRPMMRRVLDHIDKFLVQSEESARRFIDLGADPARVVVTGSLKFDSLEVSSTALQARARDRVLRYFRVPASRPVIVAGSTMKGEEIAVLRAFRRVRSTAPNTLLVLAPRNPERFGEAEQLARQEGWKVARRSDLAIDSEPRVAPISTVCDECVAKGDSWVHLRACLRCGHVGCCDQSKNKHATRHYRATQHPLIRSLERGEDWIYCYVDRVMMLPE